MDRSDTIWLICAILMQYFFERMNNVDKKGNNKKDTQSTLQALGFATGLGINFVITIGVCLYGGIYIDEKLVSSPIATISGIFLGFIAAIWSTYKKLLGKNK